jgi:hypothetical protein
LVSKSVRSLTDYGELMFKNDLIVLTDEQNGGRMKRRGQPGIHTIRIRRRVACSYRLRLRYRRIHSLTWDSTSESNSTLLAWLLSAILS